MNMILHLLRTDLRRFRGSLAVFWAALVLDGLVHVGLAPGTPTRVLLHGVLLLGQALWAVVIIVRCIQADSLTGSTAMWMTRPVARWQVLTAKSLGGVVTLLAPFLILQAVVWILAGYGWAIVLHAVVAWMLCASVLVCFAGTVAGWTRTPFTFLGVTAAILGGWALVAMPVAALLMHARVPSGSVATAGSAASATLVTLLWLCGWLLVAWGCLGIGRRKACSVGALCLGCLGTVFLPYGWRTDFLTPAPLTRSGLTVSVIGENETPTAQRDEQILWSHFRVRGLRSNEVVVVSRLRGRFEGDSGLTLALDRSWERGPWGTGPDPLNSDQAGEVLAVVKRFFPARTLWFQTASFQSHGFLSLNGLPPSYQRHPTPGHFVGRLEVHRFAVRPAARAPLRRGMIRLETGGRLRVEKTRILAGRCDVTIAMTRPRPLFLNMSRYGQGLEPTHYLMVVYHEPSGEALVFRLPRMGFMRMSVLPSEQSMRWPFQLPHPALQTRLTGVSAAQWWQEARLWVFALVPEGRVELPFEKEHYTLRLEGLPRVRPGKAGLEVIRQLRLPRYPSETGLAAYLETLLHNTPEQRTQADTKLIRQKLEALGTNAVPLLLQRLPIESRLYYLYIRFLLPPLVRPEHRALVLDALRNDPRLISLVLQKGWREAARPVALEMMRSHRQPVPMDVLAVAAETKDPATYPDLIWHFIHNERGHDRVIPLLQQCPGLDWTEAVRAAWKRARVGLADPKGLVTAAVQLGLPEALPQALTTLANPGWNGPPRKHLVRTLIRCTGYTGPEDQLEAWLGSRLGKVRFDPVRKRYVLKR